ncbi:MAG TPA: type II secretion system minor pseudopilin GspH [Spongiibacteraceae bacterium]|nr:type II secretion system minor pseudopilin GspH [Spongiibacteraceae bacterium]
MMLTSVTGQKNNGSTGRAPHRSAALRGFTLIEVLVVLVIMASMAGLLVLGFKDSPEKRLRREANDLAALLNAAADEAVLHSTELGLAIDNEGYRFVYFDGEKKQWLAMTEKMLAPHKFTDTLAVDIALDGEHIDEQAMQRIHALSGRSENASLRPLLLLLSSGEITPFTLTLGYGDELNVVLSGDGFNPIVVERG